VRQHGYRPCLGTRARNTDGSRGPYAWLTYDEVWARVSHFGSGLLNLGYKKVGFFSFLSIFFSFHLVADVRVWGGGQGDLVGIFSENRVEWVVAEQACNAYSLVCVPAYDAGDGCLQYILNHARLTVVIASRPKTFKARPPPRLGI
jgi:long-chain acyl-CoA synthetase